MARRRKRSSTKSSSIIPAWIWLTLGILIGLGIAMLTRIDGRHIKSSQSTYTDQTQNTKSETDSTKRKFDFYTLLPELEIVIPQEETKPLNKKSSTSQSSDYTGGYLLQAGSFQQHNEADSLKARLALLGVEAKIQSVKVNNTNWHRVQIGPTKDRAMLEDLRKRLRTHHIDTMLMQAKK